MVSLSFFREAGPTGFPIHDSRSQLLTIQLNNQLLLNVLRNAFPLWISYESTCHFSFVPVELVKLLVLTAEYAGNSHIGFVFFFNTDHITGFQLIRRNVHYFSVNGNVFVRYQLTGAWT
jgi:hypothetical protein